jgi:competence protein ComEA
MDVSLARYRPYLAMVLLFVIVLAGTIYYFMNNRQPESPARMTIVTPTPRATATTAALIIDVRGAVLQPGVYTLPLGSRVQDALALAGNLTVNADTRNLNLARRLNDGEQLYIPIVGEAPPATAAIAVKSGTASGPAATKNPPSKINVNTASLADLDALPGIGPAIAQRIVDYRTQNGDFKKIEDLKKVRGISDAFIEQIKDLVTLQ